MPNIPMRVLRIVLPVGVLMMVLLATLTRRRHGEMDEPTWSRAAVIVLLVYSLLIIPYLLMLRKQLSSGLGAHLRSRSIEPAALFGLAGMVMLLSPTCVALLLSLLGVPLRTLYIAAGFSVIGMVTWSVWYGRSEPEVS